MKYIVLICLTVSIFSCGGDNVSPPAEGLTLIPRHEIVSRVKAGNFDYRNAVFKNQKGGNLSEKEQKLLNAGELGKDYYEDENGVIKEVRVRPVEIKDKYIDIQRREIATNPLQSIALIEIDCEDLDNIYAAVDSSDQAVRQNRGDIAGVDGKNLQVVVSAISKCGMTAKHTQTILRILMHSPPEVMSYYYQDIVDYSNKGELSTASVAMIRDQMLVRHGYKQVYGTQILSGQLYKLEDPDNVNERRKMMGIGKIEDHLKIWGLDFEEEKKRLESEKIDLFK